ncbi:MAG: phospholipase C [Polyangiaceae bacterium]
MGARCGVACALASAALAVAWACGGQGPSAASGGADAGADALSDANDWDRPVTRPDDDAATASRAACAFARGALPAETLGASMPVDVDIPVQNIVVVMQENRSFDSYFARLNDYAGRHDIESPPAGAAVPEIVGAANPTMHPLMHAPHLCALDTNHEWDGTHLEYDDGKMDGFYQANTGWGDPPDGAAPSVSDPSRALWWYDQTDIPFYYALAGTFAIADHYFSSLLGPTWPNRDYLYLATSMGITTSAFPDLTSLPYPGSDVLIFDELERRGITWSIYADGLPPETVAAGPNILSRWPGHYPLLHVADYLSQAAAGTLPQVAFVDAVFGHDDSTQIDEHPPADIQFGQQFVSQVVQALLASPQWKTSALFFTYDEHGGYYDHVPPPPACKPDAIEPILPAGDATGGHFDRYGVRVPMVLVSPFARPGFVSHAVYDHTSITRFIEAKFRLPALTARDANASPLMEMFDFANPAFVTPPALAPAPDPTAAGIADCVGTFGP